MGTFKEATFEVQKKGKKHVFKLIHDLPDIPGMSIQDAFDNWMFRTDDHSPESLKEYILSKGTGAIVMTEKEYKQQLKSLKNERKNHS